MDHGKNFRRARERMGLSQKDAAAALEITPSFLSKIERNKKKPNVELILKAAKLYKVDRAFLLEDQNEINLDDIYKVENVDFLKNINLNSINHLQESYNIKIDGRDLTEHELKAVIAFIRSLRLVD